MKNKFKKEKLYIIFIRNGDLSERLLREFIKGNKFKIRVITDDFVGLKKKLFDIWEKFENVYEFEYDIKDSQSWEEQLKKVIQIKKKKYINKKVLYANEIIESDKLI